MKRITYIIAAIILPAFGKTQSKLMVLGKCPDCYVQYKPKTDETIEQIAALAALTPEKLMTYNGIRTIDKNRMPTFWRLPINADNLRKASNGLPVYHVIEKGDNLYRINLLYFQPGIAQIQEWNGVKSNTLKDGELLLVGYLSGNLSAVPSAPSSSGDFKSQTAIVSALPDSGAMIRRMGIVATPEEGFFADAFNKSIAEKQWQEKTGMCGTFKSITGWNDQRYYVLMNEVQPGTILRISAGGNKYVCASVLGPLPDIKVNKGVVIRLSNAAAEVLGIREPFFSVTVQYVQ